MKKDLKKLWDEIQEKKEGQSIYIGICQVDCDQVEYTSRAVIRASICGYEDFDNQVYMESEGSYSLSILTREEYANWNQPSIDHRAEQYNY
jgi:hypothetical protein